MICKKASSHQFWWRLEQKWLLTPIWPPWSLLGVKWGAQNWKNKKVIKDPKKKLAKRLLLTKFGEDWSKNDFWPHLTPPQPLLGVKRGPQSWKNKKLMRDPKKTYKKASSHQIWWILEQKLTFMAFYNPLNLKKCSVQWCPRTSPKGLHTQGYDFSISEANITTFMTKIIWSDIGSDVTLDGVQTTTMLDKQTRRLKYWCRYRIGSNRAPGFYFSKWVFGWGSIHIWPAWGCNQDHLMGFY